MLQGFVRARTKFAKMHVKNVALALLETAFHIPTSMLSTSQSDSAVPPRVHQLGLFIDQHDDKAALFVEIKGYVEKLSFSEAKFFLNTLLPRMSRQVGYSAENVWRP